MLKQCALFVAVLPLMAYAGDTSSEIKSKLDAEGKVFLRSDPVGAEVYLIATNDDQSRLLGKTPFLAKVPQGKIILVYKLAGFSAVKIELNVEGTSIQKPDAVKLEIYKKAVDVLFAEDGFQIFVNKQLLLDKNKPVTAPATIYLPFGKVEIALVKNGFQDLILNPDITEETGTISFDEKSLTKGASALLGGPSKTSSETEKTAKPQLIGQTVFSQRVLTGTQIENTIRIPAGKKISVTGEYLVPEGKALEIENGVSLLIERGGVITISGSLVVLGQPKSPVLFTLFGDSGTWKGLALQKAQSANVSYANFQKADRGVNILGTPSNFTGCNITENTIGVEISDCNRSLFENCFITNNKDDGFHLRAVSGLKILSSTISNNGGWGIWGTYYINMTFEKSLFWKNARGGVLARRYDGGVTAHGCAFIDNKPDIQNEMIVNWDFKGCYWGEANTILLRSGKETIPTIRDAASNKSGTGGRVIIGDFLLKPPEGCGAKIDK